MDFTIPSYQQGGNIVDGNTEFTLVIPLKEDDFSNCGCYIP